MDIKVIFEDEQLLVIDKPAGVVVNRADTTAKVETVQDWVESRSSDDSDNQIIRSSDAQTVRKSGTLSIPSRLEEEFLGRSGVVHRLDKDTSGLLVIAKTPAAFGNLKDQFKSRAVEKKYLALVHGQVKPESGTIKAPIARSPFNPRHFGIFPGGREATTQYKVLRNFQFSISNLQFSLLEVTPQTGRTHQIRVHLKYINHPVVSDPIYGGRKNYQADLQFCPRLFLHATFLRFAHPVAKKVLEFNSSLPADLQSALDRLQ